MLHLCNITTGVWGRYAGEDTRPFDAYSQRRVVILQRCTENGMYQICNTHVANMQHTCCAFATTHAKKKRVHFCTRNFFFVHCHILTMNTFSACTENGSRNAVAWLHAQTMSSVALAMFSFCHDFKRWRIALSAR